MGLLLTTTILGGIAWLLWRVFRLYVVKSCLDHLPGPPRSSFLAGNVSDMMRRDSWGFLDHILATYPPTMKIHGLFGAKGLYTSDPVAIHSMMVKDSLSFDETPEFIIGNNLLFGPGLVSTLGDVHRKQRKILNPAFSTAHLRDITPTFVDVATRLRNAIETQVKGSSEPVDVLNWMSRAAMEIIGQGGLGISFDPLESPAFNPHGEALKSLLSTVFDVAFHWLLTPWTPYLGPPKFRRWLLDMYPHPNIQRLKNIVDLMYSKAQDIVVQKKKELVSGDTKDEQKDIIGMLLKANMTASLQDRLPDDQVIAQVNTMILAATDTTSNASSRALELLSYRQDIQDRLRQEVQDARTRIGDNAPSYDEIMELPLLDAICRETLRLYPPVMAIDRVAQRDTVLPLGNPIRDTNGNMIHQILITEGTHVTMTSYGYNRRKDIWGDDAEEWNPDRWLCPLPDSVKAIQGGTPYSNLLTFALGSRACIGFRFAELEMKMFLFYLIESFRFSSAGVKILWNASHVVYPSLSYDSAFGSMPLKVEAIRP